MQKKLYKELWRLRFQKMLELEEGSLWQYEALLKECKNEPEARIQLKRLIKDETRHAKFVHELLTIVSQQED